MIWALDAIKANKSVARYKMRKQWK